MICKNCSTEFDGKFCPECGAPAEEIEQVAEQTAEPVAEEVAASEPMAEEVADDVVVESVTPPTTEQEDVQIPEPVAEYYEPVTVGGEVADTPKKKKKTGLIIAIIIIVLAVAAFCVASFTDLIFPKQAQFISILNNMGSGVSADFDEIESDSAEVKLSVNLNGDNDEVASVVPEEAIDLINSLGLSWKMSKKSDSRIDAIMSVFEGDKKIVDALSIISEDAMYLKGDFSDTVFMLPVESDEDSVKLNEYAEYVKKELEEVLRKNEPVKGTYKGAFDIGEDVKTLTVTLTESEINDTINKIIPEGFATFGVTETFEAPEGGYGIKEVSVSSLYSGAFAFARKSLGVSVKVKMDISDLTNDMAVYSTGAQEIEFEIIFYSDKESKAIYGVNFYAQGVTGGIVCEDNYEIKNGEQTGVVNMKLTGALDSSSTIGTVSMPSVTYSIKKNSFNYNIRMADSGDIVETKFSAVRDDKGLAMSADILLNSEKLGGYYATIAKCEPVSADFDTSKAVDITKDELTDAEQEAVMNVMTDLQTLIDSNEDSVLLALVGELLGGTQGDFEAPIEQYMWDEYGIEFYYTGFDTDNRASYVVASDEMIDVQEFGYNGDKVVEMAETAYIYVGNYSESQREQVFDALEDSFAYTDKYDGVWVVVFEEGDYAVLYMWLSNLDDPQNVKDFINLGLISAASGTTELSFSATDSALVSGGYERVE